jgi:hypothetical protein
MGEEMSSQWKPVLSSTTQSLRRLSSVQIEHQVPQESQDRALAQDHPKRYIFWRGGAEVPKQ